MKYVLTTVKMHGAITTNYNEDEARAVASFERDIEDYHTFFSMLTKGYMVFRIYDAASKQRDRKLREIAKGIRLQAKAMEGHWVDSRGGGADHLAFLAGATRGHFNDLATSLEGMVTAQADAPAPEER